MSLMTKVSATHRGWWQVGLGIPWLGVAVWLAATRASALLAGHPAQAIAVVAVAMVGGLLIAAGARDIGRTRRIAQRRRWVRVTLRSLGLLVTLVVVGSMAYLRPFTASADAIAAMSGTQDVAVSDTATTITLTPRGAQPSTGLVFQPGARVDPRAYVPLLTQLGEQGYLAVVVKQPFNIGFTATRAPGGIIEDHPEVDAWAVGGHSLGGVAASSYAGDHLDEIDGLLLWASYPLDTLAEANLVVASVSGTEDGLAVPADIEASAAKLPADTAFVPVQGGVHAYFGDYGTQPGDGEPTISRSAAQQQIVEASADLLSEVETP
ncbi:MAG: alpha/beta hydrolase [Ornithinimicrobium sp.]